MRTWRIDFVLCNSTRPIERERERATETQRDRQTETENEK